MNIIGYWQGELWIRIFKENYNVYIKGQAYKVYEIIVFEKGDY